MRTGKWQSIEVRNWLAQVSPVALQLIAAVTEADSLDGVVPQLNSTHDVRHEPSRPSA